MVFFCSFDSVRQGCKDRKVPKSDRGCKARERDSRDESMGQGESTEARG